MGWDYPKTWDAMLAMCAMIKKTTKMSPWTFQGKYPNYILNPILQMAAKIGGADVLRDLDNLEPGAWLSDPVRSAGAAFHELAAKGYVLPGTPGLTHIQSQTKWAQGQAVFIPCGSWLENEIKAVTPKTFDMVLNPVPSHSGSDKLPFDAIWAGASEGFIVPSQAKNVPGALEFLRIVLSKQASTEFSRLTHVLGVISGYANAIDVSTAFNTARDAVTAAGKNTLNWQFGTWYAKMESNVENATGSMMAGETTADEWSKRCQKAADDTKKDSSIKKYHR
jgi:N-acetylglucosamine transport system substrate-binding protein